MMELKKQSRKSLKITHAKNKKTRRRSLEIGSLYLVEKVVLWCFIVTSII